MRRADRKTWAAAGSLADLGELMAQYLEGGLSGCPSHPAPLDPETRGLEPTLAALCRAGFVTDCSQPGYDGPGHGGHWRQRAAVQGYAAPAVADRITQAARAARLDVLVDDRHGTLVTTLNGRPYTGFGQRLTRRELKHVWQGIGHGAFRELAASRFIAIVAPEWGPAGDRIWPILATAVR